MSIWIAVFLFLHVMGAIIAFGPGYSAPLLGQLTAQQPQHANFAARFNELVTDRRVEPLAIFQGITGLVLIYLTGFNPFTTLWLGLGIALYLVALAFALGVQRPTVKKIVELTSTPPPPGASGPPPELMAAVKRAQQGGMFLGVLVVVIVILMVTKPTL